MAARKFVPVLPAPDRIRRIQGSFAWLDHRLLREGHLEHLTLVDLAVYVFLVLAADSRGLSFYSKASITKKLQIDWDAFEGAKARLLERGLVAFRPFAPGDIEGTYQVLPIPPGVSR
ncbi:MAG TPA: hypothetical protein VG457_13745 [Planctomycetota bacterium]|jgi:hypothetical protein|nr:hypothetical protein [Planctomycetota bacterium]